MKDLKELKESITRLEEKQELLQESLIKIETKISEPLYISEFIKGVGRKKITDKLILKTTLYKGNRSYDFNGFLNDNSPVVIRHYC